MPIYLALMKLTDHGVQNIKNAPARIEQSIKDFEAAGGKLIDFYIVMGEQDFVCLVEGPTDEMIMRFSLRVSSASNVKITLLKAFSREQFAEAVRELP
jgi:uncharacterized protein with GYD domain